MLEIVHTIAPIFIVILTGLVLRKGEFLPQYILGPLNRLVFYVAIPVMIFQAVAKADFQAHFHLLLLLGALLPPVFILGLAAGASGLLSMPRQQKATFLQSSFHGNLGYIGLAVAYYYLGEQGLTQASILSGFLMLLQNFLSVCILQPSSESNKSSLLPVAKNIVANPIIVAALAGLFFSGLEVPIPVVVSRSLDIVSGMALPLALLVIGASLSVSTVKDHLGRALLSGGLKLLVLPLLGYILFLALGLERDDYLPAIILLAAPSATVTFVMASEMNGSTQLASATITLNTLLSALTYVLWLSFA